MSDGHPKVMPGGAEGDGLAYDFSSRGITDERHLQHPPSAQRAGPELRPRHAGACRAEGGARRGRRAGDRDPRGGRRPRGPDRRHARRGLAPLSSAGAGAGAPGRWRHDLGGGQGRGRGPAGLGPLALRGPGGGLPQGCGAAGHGAPPAGQCLDHAGAEQDGLPGGDRQRLRADRLPPLSTCTSPSGSTGSSRSRRAGAWNRTGSPAAGRVRLRHHAVQLHGHRRQPADCAGADGQRGGVEACRTARRSATGTSSSCSRRRGFRRA